MKMRYRLGLMRYNKTMPLTKKQKAEIDASVRLTIKMYGETLLRLAET